jgi:1-acyl-sn-glycerol-3-phosphate acyltransferase
VALIDPVLLYLFLRQKISVHPVATRHFYDNMLLKPLFKLMGTIPVEVFDHDQGTVEDAEKMMKHVSATLAHHENVLLYPQGELAKQGYQSIIGKKTAFYAVQHSSPETKCIMVSIR